MTFIHIPMETLPVISKKVIRDVGKRKQNEQVSTMKIFKSEI